MSIRFASLGSGSKGNGTLVESLSTCLLVDCGFSVRETEKRLARLDRTPEDLTAILVTHEHGDHLRGAVMLSKKYQIPVMMTAGTALGGNVGKLNTLKILNGYDVFSVGDFTITQVAVPHDAREPVQFVFESKKCSVGILTDLGSISPHVLACFGQCDGLLLEANHDSAMLAEGIYPASLKRRVGSDWGHLNNQQSAQLLSLVERSKLQCLVMGHISVQNNRQQLVMDAIADYQDDVGMVLYACQQQGFDWQVIH